MLADSLSGSPSRIDEKEKSVDMKGHIQGDDGGLHLRYHIFDWDDNIVHMPTKILMEDVKDGTPVPLSTSESALRD